ncbi:MAG: tRNA pseudouridine(55) synthase TruB [Moorea sp. SIO2B7]|nr:tRNA pseudouridine(55) synthase TruB [Moorena sp. SIO2B7]
MTTNGFLNLNKPSGFTSHDCVAKVRRILNMKKVGHGGTLDPTATGVLPIAVGKATRLLQFLPQDKAYRARIRFGVRTITDDLGGDVIESHSAATLTLEEIKPLLSQFKGKIEQIPPAYSAIQRGGKRLYELARKGEKVKVPVRTVEVSQIEILAWYPGEFPELELAIACGTGTYIRAIARDLGANLKVGGTLAALTRTLSCSFHLENSITFEKLEANLQQQSFNLIPPDVPLEYLGSVKLPEDKAKRWCQGQKIAEWTVEKNYQSTTKLRVYDENEVFLGIGEVVDSTSKLLLIPKTVIYLVN